MLEREKRNIDKTATRCVSSNYFGEKCKEQTLQYIEEGYWVHFCADCIGHTRAALFQLNGEEFLVDHYGEPNLQCGENEHGFVYFRLR